MPKQDELCDHVVDLLSPLGVVSYRYMFGGYGIYVDGVMMAIVDEGVLYLKADEENRSLYEALGMERFRPYPHKPETMPYHEVPSDLFDDQDRLVELARHAVSAGRRTQARKRSRKREPRG